MLTAVSFVSLLPPVSLPPVSSQVLDKQQVLPSSERVCVSVERSVEEPRTFPWRRGSLAEKSFLFV